jgi:hypothetical protein
MIMRRIIYILAAAVLLAGCEKYHPLHDGQKFRAYHKDYSLIEGEGREIYLPLQGKSFNLELSGGHGGNHTILIDNPEYLDYTYFPGKVSTEAFYEPEIIPDIIMLSSKKLGKTRMTIINDGTGETIKINVNICESYHALSVISTQNSLEERTLLCFRYGGTDNVVRFCRGNISRLQFEHIVDGTYVFRKKNNAIYLEMTFPADEYRQPSREGTETFRRYKVLDAYNYGYQDVMGLLNLNGFPVQTKAYYDEYYRDALMVDVTEDEKADPESPETKCFYCNSTQIIPWYFDAI